MTEVAQETPVEIAASADRKEDDDVFGPDVSEGTTKSESTKKSGMSRRAKKVSKVASESQQADKKGQKKKTSKSSVRESLSADAMEIISKIQQRQTDAPKAGRVSVADLMTSYREKEANTSIMQRLLQKPLTAVNVLATAASERPAVPGFPRAADNATQGVLPEILMNALNIGQNAEVRRGNRSPNHHSRPTAEERVLPDRLPPWISLSPMYPLEEKYIHSQQRMNTFGPRRPDNRPDRSYPQHGRHESNSGPGKTSGNSMARKPFFMPYMSGDMVSRGLAAKDLIKGSLRVNQRNFEESYIDNPEGNDQMDLLIYGLQDRNRALHGDVVVVRIKQRNQWIVRENLYNAWRHNELKATCDDDGKPLTVPPVPVPKEEGVVELVLGGTAEVKIKQEELCKVVPVSENAKYGREEMILMGAQAEISRRSKQAGGDHQIPLNASLNPHLEEMITNLSLKRIELQDLGLVTPSTKIQPKRPIGQKKGALRTVAEMPDEDWGMPDCCLQKTAEVVFIAEQKNCRAAMGQLKVMNDNNKNWALFSPTDSRMPRMMIPGEQVPKGFFDRPQDFLKFVFVARLVEWQAANQFARGRLERSLGVAGDPDVETEGLLFSNNVDAREFPPSSLQSLPDTATEAWTIPQDELTGRRDFREETVFTIDPKTARDLDDALHIKYCEDVDGKGKSGWEVGVHIADVTYFLTEGTELDEWAAQRATSVYLVHKVIPMLPRVLCEELCSLNPGVDRLTFSVIWKIDDEGTIYSEEFVRSVIRSKVKLAYEHAQDFIEHPDKEFAVNELPEIFDDISVATIKEKVLHLNNIALKLRGQRVQNGALRLDQPKLKFALDDAGKLPMGVAVYEIKDANRLVEEYMLLANMAVARRIEEHYPSTAMLRRHPAPKQKVMREVLEICQKIGFPLDATSSGLLSSSLNKYMGDTTLMRSINQVLSMLMMKPMQLAQYFCVGTMENKSDYAHYALACPYYTHFTSPIRRYPDVMVHRFLAASLKYTQPPNMSIQEIQKLAEHCNDKKLSAKTVSEGSDEIFFGLFVKACGPLNERAVVINVLDASFDVLVFKYGVIKRVYLNKLNMAREHIHVEGPPSKLVLFWNDKDHGVLEQTIQMCTVVDVELSVESTNEPSVKYKAVIKPSTPKTLRELMLKGETLDEGTTRIPDVRPLGDLYGRKRASDVPKSTARVKAVRAPKGNRVDEAWKMSIVDTLHAELQKAKREARDAIHLRQSSAQLIRLAVDEDVLSMIPLMDAYLRKMAKIEKPTPLFDEFLSVCTLLVHRNLLPFVDGRKEPNDRLATSICFSFNNLIHKLKVDGPDTRISLLLLYDLFERWSKLRAHDEHTREINIFIERFEAKLRRITPTLYVTRSRLVLKETDREELLRVTNQLKIPIRGSSSEDSGYDENNDLVRPLEGSCRDEDYLENPFNIKGKDVKYYLEQLDKQLKLEDAAWIRIDNFWKNRSPNVTESAEDLIEKWEWRERIAAEVEKQLGTLPLYPVKVYTEVLDRKELVDLILEAVTASCSLGQLLVPKPVFINNLTAPIMKNAHSKFFNKLGINLDEIWRQIMADYLQYFVNDEIARTHTHRQWWSKICQRNGIPVDYQAPFLHAYGEMRQQLENFLNSVVLDACCFPHRTDSGKVEWMKAFSLRNVGIEEESRVTEEGRYNSSPMVHLNDKMMKLFDQHQFNYILFPTGELPMTVPPRPWVDKGIGGPDFKRGKHVLRNQSEYLMVDNNREMAKRLKDESQARPVFDALNQLGSTPWIINEPMLEVLCQVFSMSTDISQKKTLNTLSVPLKSSSVEIPCVETFKSGFESVEAIAKEDWRNFYKSRQEAEKNKNEMNSLWYWMMYRVVLAKHFRGQMLFFPHNMDFRGRVYPISPYLNHMGDDVNRCILKFAKGKPLGPNGLSWLKLHCINLTGKMKRKSVADRLQEAEDRLPDILDSANDPLTGRGWWMESEEPWQTLAACMELRDVLASGGVPDDFVSHLPIHQDGSCNGLQHYAALGRDKQGGSEVNLLPEKLPSDVYSSVAVRVEQKRLEDEKTGGDDQEVAQKLRLALPQAVPRKVIKQTVMTTVYGVTMYGAVQQIKRQLKALDIDNEDTGKFASYLARKTFASLHDAFTSSMQLKDWFRTCAKGTNELMRTVEWVTPLGLPVVQPYLRDKMTKNRLILQPIPMKQIDAFPPNYVHSLDSTHMMLTSLECARRGVTFAAVHDCFWTHASTADTMNEICRQQFVNLHNQPLVDQLSDWFLDHYLPTSVMTALPQEEKDKFMRIFTPSVQPGDLDIDEVKKSVYFFS